MMHDLTHRPPRASQSRAIVFVATHNIRYPQVLEWIKTAEEGEWVAADDGVWVARRWLESLVGVRVFGCWDKGRELPYGLARPWRAPLRGDEVF